MWLKFGTLCSLQSAQNKIVLKALAKNLAHPKFGTDTAAGIEAARNMINDQGRPQAPEIIVVITDGRSTNPRNTILQVPFLTRMAFKNGVSDSLNGNCRFGY